jgi:phosphoserine aminotransferase
MLGKIQTGGKYMTERIFNFSAGPATLPVEVLKEAQAELLNYHNTGMSILEMSHRTKPYEAINAEAEATVKELLGVGDDYRALFLQGGASTQFAMLPMNILRGGRVANYILTGSWGEKAYEEAKLFGNTHVAASTAEGNYRRIPQLEEIQLSKNPAYVHITSNETIFGNQWSQIPSCGDVPLVADMSSDLFCKPVDATKFGLIYAGAQKNLGPAGVTIVVIRKDLLDGIPKTLPTMLRYDVHAKNDSLYNTPPTFAVYMVNLVLHWIKAQGGLGAVEKQNRAKANLLYDAIDNSGGFYRGHAEAESRSIMNVTFRITNEELEEVFVKEATKAGLDGLKGHRSVGGLRASIYNAMSREGCQALRDFMAKFQQRNG